MKVTLHEVAARADVSIATASRAINGLPVSERNLARVRQAIAELGYVANQAARALRSDRSQTIGVIFSDLRNMLGIDLLDGLGDTVEAAGYSLLIATARGDAQRFDLLMRRFLERRVDALFCIRPPARSDSLAGYAASGKPVISIFGAAGAFSALPNLSPSFAEAARDLGDHLRALGHVRIAMLHARRSTAGLDAVAQALRARDFHVDTVEIAEGAGTAEVIAELMAHPARPTALLAPDPTVRGVIAACAKLGVDAPGAISVISLNDVASDAHHRRHGVAAITVDPQRMGRACGAAMLDWLAGSRPAERTRVENATYYPRATVGPAPA